MTAMPIDEAALVSRLRARDDEAFSLLVRTYMGRLLRVARRFLKSEEDARDAVQDAFVSAFKSIDSFKAGSTLATWLHRIVVNSALMPAGSPMASAITGRAVLAGDVTTCTPGRARFRARRFRRILNAACSITAEARL